jgi:hypothetical protein
MLTRCTDFDGWPAFLFVDQSLIAECELRVDGSGNLAGGILRQRGFLNCAAAIVFGIL